MILPAIRQRMRRTHGLLPLSRLVLLVGALLLVPAIGARISAAGPALLVRDINPGPDGSIDPLLFFDQNPD